jgi:hypothetical protein
MYSIILNLSQLWLKQKLSIKCQNIKAAVTMELEVDSAAF